MPGFYTNRSKSYDFDLDYASVPASKYLVIDDETYVFGGSLSAEKNSLFITDENGNRRIGFSVDGAPYGIVSDGFGGFFIYGDFNYVTEKYRRGIAHFNSSGYLTEWNAGLNGAVFDASVKDTTVYVGGDFTTSKGLTRNRLAAFSLSGQILTWNPNLSSAVFALQVVGDNIYVGGSFTSVGLTARNYLAAVNTLGSLLTWNPSASANVYDIKYRQSDTLLYICGQHASINGNAIPYLSVVTTDGTVQNFNLGINGTVRSVDFFGSNIYLGGDFTIVGGNTRNYIAAVNSSANVLSWDLNPNGQVSKVFVDTTNIYISGVFEVISGVRRDGLAIVNTNGSVQDYNINTFANLIQRTQNAFLYKFQNNTYAWTGYQSEDYRFGLYKLAKSGEYQKIANIDDGVEDAVNIGSNIYIGGLFGRVGGSWSSLAIFSTTGTDITNVFVNNNASYDYAVSKILQTGVSDLYLVGSFQSANEQTRTGIAHINSTGQVSSFNVDVVGNVLSIAVSGSNIYIGGQFSYVNGTQRSNLAAVNTSGSLLSWNPSADSGVRDIKILGNDIYIGGFFTSVNSTTRNRLAAINTAGSLLPWNPSANNQVFEMQILGNNIYVGGWFTSINGTARNNLAAINIISVNATGNVLTWAPIARAGVSALAIFQNVVYVGGDFTTINDNARNYLAAVDTAGTLLSWNPSASGFVYGIAASGSNVYVGGRFTSINGNARNRLAAINTSNVNASGNVLSWNPYVAKDSSTLIPANGPTAIATLGSNIYVGWNFPQLLGPTAQARNYLAGVNTSGGILAWNPSANHNVFALEVVGSNIYVGGSFTSINGNTRHHIAAINTTANVLTFPASVSDGFTATINSIKNLGDNLYVSGTFSAYGLASSFRILKTDSSSPPQVASLPNTINTIVVDSTGGAYIGGDFTSIGGVTRNRLAYINSSGQLTSWNPNVNAIVYSMAISNTSIYIGGNFTSIGGSARRCLAALSTVNVNATGNVLAWNPSAGNTVLAMNISGDSVYVGGFFATVNGNARNHLAAINTVDTNTTGNILAWAPSVTQNTTVGTNVIYSITISGTNIYVGGIFGFISSSIRQNIGVINTAGTLQTWNPAIDVTDPTGTDAQVRTIAVIGTNVYIGGFFDTINGIARKSLGAVNTLGVLQAWSPNISQESGFINLVYAMAISGSNIYFGGNFNSVNGIQRNKLAAVDTAGALLSWRVNSGSVIRALTISGTNIYTGAILGATDSSIISGDIRARLAAINTSGSLLSWNPSASGNVFGVKIYDNVVYAYGEFSNTATLSSYRAITEGGIENTITSVALGGVSSIVPDGSGGIYIGGNFEWVDGLNRHRLAYINSSGSVTQWNPSANGIVDAMLISGTSIYIGGEFTSVNGNTRNRLAAINTVNVNATGNVLGWNPNANNTVYSMSIIGANIYIGGAFTVVNGNTRNYLAAVNTTANVISTWNPSANANVLALTVVGSNIYVGGDFTLVNGNTRTRLAGINVTANVIAWTPSANATVRTIAIAGSDVYFGGDFTVVSAVTRRYLAGQSIANVQLSWNPSASGNVYALAISGTNIYVGGDFTSIGSNTRNDLAAVNTSGTILSWNPSSSAVVCTLATSNGVVYVGKIDSGSTLTSPKNRGLLLISPTGSMAPYPKVDLQKPVQTIGFSGNNIYVAGTSFSSTSLNTLFNTANYLYTTNEEGKVLRRYSLTRGVTNGGPGVYDFAVDVFGGVYIAGEFGSVDGITANNIAYINSSGSVVSWGIGTNDVVHDIAINGDNIYIGGWFTAVNGIERQRLAAVSTVNINATGNLLTWNPSASSNVYDIDIANNTIYVGGSFTSVNGNVRNRLAAINTSGGVLSWNPSASGLVADLKILGSNVYIGGEFLSVNLVTRRYLAAINTVDVNAAGNVLAWNPSASNSSYSMAISGTNIFVGGAFNSVSSIPRNLAVINTAGSLQSLNVQILFNTDTLPEYGTPQSIISCIDVDGSNIYAGGINIQAANGQLTPGAFAVNTSGSVLSFSAIGNWISRIRKIGSTIFVAPTLYGFTPIYGGESTIPNFITLDKTTLLLKSINIDTDSAIYDIAVKNESILLNSRKSVFDAIPSYKISDERELNSVDQNLN